MNLCTHNNRIVFMFFLTVFAWQMSDARRAPKKKLMSDAIATQCDVPNALGKTHFIVGYSQEQLKKYDAQKKEKTSTLVPDKIVNLMCDGCIKCVLFSPDDNIQKILLQLIDGEQESIRLTAYSFTDGDVAQSLIRAHDRGVKVEIIADPACMLDRFGKIPLIKDHDIVVFVYDPDHLKNDKKGLSSSIMHNKFIIFGKNITGKSIIWTGSFNWTKSAHRRNQENVIIFEDKHVIDKYAQQFEVLKTRCKGIKPKKEMIAKRVKETSAFPILLSKKGTLFEHNEVRV